MDYGAFILSRMQFAFTISFHIIFPAFTIGLAAWLAFLEGASLVTKQPVYRRLFDFWLRIFAIAFGLGVVSGIVMEFQFGTNWSELARRSGSIQGGLLAYESMSAFALEAAFFDVLTWRRSSQRSVSWAGNACASRPAPLIEARNRCCHFTLEDRMTEPSAALVVHSQEPFNAEPTLARLRAHILTDISDFYVRSHGNVPEIDAEAFRLKVVGLVKTPLELSLDDLRADFDEHTVEAVMQCAGNRRADLDKLKPVTGDPWNAGAIGNARWTGVRLVDVLTAAGADTGGALHVAFSALDECEVDGKTFRYGASIPMEKAKTPEVLLCYAMNDEPLEPKHGFPLRVVTPGYAGVRSPKWLAAIEVRDAPSDNPIQAEDYKMLPPDIDRAEDIDWYRGITINELPLNSAICEPADGAELPPGRHRLRGYAMASDRAITRVDVSTDGGESWLQAELEGEAEPWRWTFWHLDAELLAGRHELVVRAWDGAGQTQPARADDTWNVKGYLSAAWHRIAVVVR